MNVIAIAAKRKEGNHIGKPQAFDMDAEHPELQKVQNRLNTVDVNRTPTDQHNVVLSSSNPFGAKVSSTDSVDNHFPQQDPDRTFQMPAGSKSFQTSSAPEQTQTEKDGVITPAHLEGKKAKQGKEGNAERYDDVSYSVDSGENVDGRVGDESKEQHKLREDGSEKQVSEERAKKTVVEDNEHPKEQEKISTDAQKEEMVADFEEDRGIEDVVYSGSQPKSELERHSSYQADVVRQLSKKGSLIKERVLKKDKRKPDKTSDSLQESLSETGKCSFSPVSNCTDSDSESETEKENKLRAALEVLLFPAGESNADDARRALNQARRSLRTGTKFRTKRLNRFLREVYRAMKDFEEDRGLQERACVVLGKIAREMPSTQLTIAETGGVKHILEAIERHKECDTVQDQGIFALLSLTGDSAARGHIVEQRGAECISWAMTEFQDARTILTNGSTTLCNLAFDSEEGKTRIGKVGGIDAIVNAMNRHQDDADLQTRCCLALRNLTCGLRANQWIAGRACAMESIDRCMKKFPKDANVQYQGCAALANLCSNEPENRDRATGIGVIATCMRAMECNMDHISLIEHGLAVLRNICLGNSENQMRIGAADGLKLILHALKQHRSNEKILVKGCSALRFLFFSRLNREAMFDIGGLEPLIRVIRDGEKTRAVAEGAILALGNAVFDHEEGKRLVGRCGGIAAVVDVMSKHLDAEAIQEYGCRALRNLADSDELNTRLLGDSGAVDTAIFAMMGYPKNGGIQEHSCAMLFNMAFSEHNIRIMLEVEVARVVEHATEFHLQSTAIQCQANALLQRLRPFAESSSLTDQFSTRTSVSLLARKKSSADLRKNGSGRNIFRAKRSVDWRHKFD